MSSRYCIIALSLWVSLFLQEAAIATEYVASSTDDGMEVLTRGPIHEAFAEVSVDEAKPEMVISRSVPESINEIPPDYRPEGSNVQWIPGYWSWDDDRNDFIWLSGVWRDVPPGRQWVPGYWVTVSGGNQFVSGYWTETQQAATVYLPPPPEPQSTAPGGRAYSADSVWIDGHWLWSANGYVWQAGYWQRPQPEMAWIPAHYVWTPRGHIFVRGYWDYHIVRRGVMFAPRYYSRPIYRVHDYYYTPRVVLDIDAIFLSLFIRQNHRHYYFGDYHDVRHEKRGFHPWYSKYATRHGHDPYYKSYRWYRSRHDHQWERNYHDKFEYRRNHREARPPVRYRPSTDHDFARSHGGKNQMIGRSFDEVVRKNDRDFKKNDRDFRYTRSRPDDKRDDHERDRKIKNPKTERRQIEGERQRKDNSWKKNVINPGEQQNRSDGSSKSNADRARISEGRQRGEPVNHHIKPYQRAYNQLPDSQADSQPRQKDRGRRGNDQPRIDQPNSRDVSRDKQPETLSGSNQNKRNESKRERRIDRQPSNDQERRQPRMAVGQDNAERQVRQQRNPADQRQGQIRERSQERQNRKPPVDPGGQVDGQGTVVHVDGKNRQRSKGTWEQRANRSYE